MAEDYTAKRRELAARLIDAATRIVEDVRYIAAVGPELAQAGGGFQDADFVGVVTLPNYRPVDISHVNAYKMNVLANITGPALNLAGDATIAADSTTTHKEILLAVKRA